MDVKSNEPEKTCLNPFCSSVHLSFPQKIKIAILAVTLLPIRLIAVGLILCFGATVGFLSNFGVKRVAEPEPYKGARRFGQLVMSYVARALSFAVGFHWIRTKGELASPEEAPVVVAAPHFSFVDGSVFAGMGRMTYMSRKENDDMPFIGHAVRVTQPIYVTRGNKSTRDEVVKEILRRSRSKGEWPHIGVFPEGCFQASDSQGITFHFATKNQREIAGTCTNGKCLITFKPGAFYAGVPVQPVLFKYKNNLDCVCWTWIGPSTLCLLMLMMCQFYNTVEIEILPVYKPNEEERQNPFLYGKNVRAVMAKALNLPVSDHSFEDCILMEVAKSKNLPIETGIVRYTEVNRELGLNLDSLKELLGKFADIDKNKDGLITFDEFSSYLKDVSSERARTLFNEIDKDRNEFIDFKTFIYAVSKAELPELNDIL